MSDWLYPLSSKSGYYFELPDGTRTTDTGPVNFEASVRRGKPDDTWGLSKNYKNVQRGDRVWVYFGRADGDLGVAGLATVAKKVSPGRDRPADICLKWDIPATKRLILRPFPADEIRAVVWPRAAVADLTPHVTLVRRLLRQANINASNTSKAPVGKRPVPTTLTYLPPRQVTVRRRHDALIWPVKTRLETSGWRVSPFPVKPKRFDLAMAKGRDILLAEFKTVGSATRQPVRDAFAQLHEYAWRHRQMTSHDPRRVWLWAVFERAPSAEEVGFLEDHDILVSWASRARKRVLHGPRSGAMLSQLGA